MGKYLFIVFSCVFCIYIHGMQRRCLGSFFSGAKKTWIPGSFFSSQNYMKKQLTSTVQKNDKMTLVVSSKKSDADGLKIILTERELRLLQKQLLQFLGTKLCIRNTLLEREPKAPQKNRCEADIHELKLILKKFAFN